MIIFQSTRLRLTIWYLAIITIIVISFSAIIYRSVTSDIEHSFRAMEHRVLFDPGLNIPPATVKFLLSEDLQTAKRAVLIRLLGVNGIIIAISGLAAHFLARKSLQPIEEAVEEQKRFIADASHELRTPLTALKSEIEVALRGRSFTSKAVKDLLSSNLEEVDKMQKLTNYLLSLSRYEGNPAKLSMQQINISEIVKKVINKYQPQADLKQITLSTQLTEVTIKVNPTNIEELLSILTDNAIKYTPPNGKVTVGVDLKNHQAIIQVSDTGMGIKAGDLPYIFNRFYRADTARSKTKIDGYGLGLPIAKSIVDMHHGRIDVDSTPGKGTTFTVMLPR